MYYSWPVWRCRYIMQGRYGLYPVQACSNSHAACAAVAACCTACLYSHDMLNCLPACPAGAACTPAWPSLASTARCCLHSGSTRYQGGRAGIRYQISGITHQVPGLGRAGKSDAVFWFCCVCSVLGPPCCVEVHRMSALLCAVC